MTDDHDQRIDTFLCVHHRDVDYLLETALRAMLRNFSARRSTMLVTNDVSVLSRAVESWGLADKVDVSSDADWLSARELTLPGWYKQQIIKLRSYEFCTTDNFCNVGADTVMLRPVSAGDLVAGGKPVVYYTRHRPRDLHWVYERLRLHNVSRILKVRPKRAASYVDFINDLFCFNRDDLLSLDALLKDLYGPEPYFELLKDFGDKPGNQKRFGEWTLYDTYVLDGLRSDVDVRATNDGFLSQVHDQKALDSSDFTSKVMHFVAKDFDVDDVKRRIAGAWDLDTA